MNTPIPDWVNAAARDIDASLGLDAFEEGLEDMAQIIANAHSRATQTLTCIACGESYPPGTPASQAEALNAHIRVCEKHPLGIVRRALVGLVGVDTKEELDQMEGQYASSPLRKTRSRC